jgi:hypothetical protein
VYDIGSKESFEGAKDWVKELLDNVRKQFFIKFKILAGGLFSSACYSCDKQNFEDKLPLPPPLVTAKKHFRWLASFKSPL